MIAGLTIVYVKWYVFREDMCPFGLIGCTVGEENDDIPIKWIDRTEF
jgi:hypothetical protein